MLYRRSARVLADMEVHDIPRSSEYEDRSVLAKRIKKYGLDRYLIESWNGRGAIILPGENERAVKHLRRPHFVFKTLNVRI